VKTSTGSVFLLTFAIACFVDIADASARISDRLCRHHCIQGWPCFSLALVVLPFWTSVLVRAYAWLSLLQRTGVLTIAVIIASSTSRRALVHNSFGTVVRDRAISAALHGFPLYGTMQKIPERADAGWR